MKGPGTIFDSSELKSKSTFAPKGRNLFFSTLITLLHLNAFSIIFIFLFESFETLENFHHNHLKHKSSYLNNQFHKLSYFFYKVFQ